MSAIEAISKLDGEQLLYFIMFCSAGIGFAFGFLVGRNIK